MSMSDDVADESIDETGGSPLSGALFGTSSEVVAQYSHCALCGSNLHFTHITDFSRNLTQETARCPECGIKIRRVMHKLQ
jgi:hypothetical protein